MAFVARVAWMVGYDQGRRAALQQNDCADDPNYVAQKQKPKGLSYLDEDLDDLS